MNMTTLNVDLAPRGYPIFIGRGLLAKADCFAPYLPGRQVLIVTDETVAPLYLSRLVDTLAAFELDHMTLAAGEQHKTLRTASMVFDRLLQRRFSRDCAVIALGGGVVGDIAGYAAACYQRGVSFIQAPTTLLAQVDSSVGGKTGVNHPLGKNMIGVFHQPVAVVADTDTLATLPDRQLRAGLAEVIKYGLIRDLGFFQWLEQRMDGLLQRRAADLAEAIVRSCRNKAAVVAADEREMGQRALLNLGHTYGHAIETTLGYGRWLHGEAVAAGMCMAARHSARLGWLATADVERVERLVGRAGLPVARPRALSALAMLRAMRVDKKVRRGVVRLILLKAIGEAVITSDYPPRTLRATLQASD